MRSRAHVGVESGGLSAAVPLLSCPARELSPVSKRYCLAPLPHLSPPPKHTHTHMHTHTHACTHTHTHTHTHSSTFLHLHFFLFIVMHVPPTPHSKHHKNNTHKQ